MDLVNCCIPKASVRVKTAGRPSGIAATARETAVRNVSTSGIPLNISKMKINTQTIIAIRDNVFPSLSIFSWSGVDPFSSWITSAIFPIEVFIPIAVMIPTPLPRVTFESIYPSSFGDLSTGTDSPVKLDSSTFKLLVSINTKSPGILSPSSRITISPIVNSFESTFCTCPSLLTTAWDVVTLLSISIAFSERYSCINPIIVFKSTAIKIIQESITSPTKYAAIAATISRAIKTSTNCSKNSTTGLFFFFSCNSFSPFSFWRFVTSLELSPSLEVLYFFKNSSI